MSPDLEQALTEFLNQGNSLIGQGMNQLPDVLKDIVAYRIATDKVTILVCFVVCIGILSTSAFMARSIYKWAKERSEKAGFNTFASDEMIFPVILGMVGLVGLLFVIGRVWDLYYVTHFPRLVILDYLRGLK